ncbi:MAG: MBOAT family protein [Oscillospiraceae bacterium]|nr:MBOAT family protein [Oscillospiraceae bacterium]
MVFSSAEFLFLFLPCVLLVYYNPLFRGRRFRNIFLLLASLFFYAWGEPVYVLLLLLSIGVNWLLGSFVGPDKPHRRGVLAAAVGFNLAGLFVFKYLGFVCENLRLWGLNAPEIRLALPIGISFYTFQAMSYVIDVYRGKSPAQRSVLDVGLYVAFFPQLIAGPIVRYETVAAEIHGRQESWEDFRSGVPRLIVGLGKKSILANSMALVADAAFQSGSLSAPMAWLGAVAYGLQIYFDFSGYSDMAIGLGRMFGFHFLENFDRPYLASSVTDFWRRWHISLSTWFRDYVYIPLGGNRVGPRRHLLNLFAVWMLTGIWHGANWTFLLWGVGYFLLLMAEKYGHLDRYLGVLRRPYTLLCVLLLWVLFRADNLGHAGQYFAAMFTGGRPGCDDFWYYFSNMKGYLATAVLCCLPLDRLWRKIPERPRAWLACGGQVLLLLLVLTYIASSTYNPFIYFNF